MSSVYFDPAVGGDGSTVTDDANATTGLANGGHRTRFVPSLAQVVAVAGNVVTKAQAAAAAAATAVNAPGTQATSTTSVAIGTGSKSFTIQTGKAFAVGQFVIAASAANVGSFMLGQITAHNSTTGALTVNATTTGGSGTYADWTIAVSAPGAGDVTQTGTQTLTNKTLGSGTVLGANVTGGDFLLTRTMLKDQGFAYYDSSTTSALDYVNGSHQRWAPSGTVTLSVSNWAPSGNLSELLIEGVNLGAATITWPTVNWVKSDGTTTTTFSSNGVALQASGTDWVYLWTRDGGTTIYGKVVR